MQHYDFATIKRQHAQTTKRLAEVTEEIAAVGAQVTDVHHRDRLMAALTQEKTRLETEIWQMENSHAWKTAEETARMSAQRERERQLQARVQERSARIHAEREAYQRQVDEIDWSLVNVPDWTRRELAREHIAKMNEMTKQRDLLSAPEADEILNHMAAQHGVTADSIRETVQLRAFETRVQDKQTGNHYVIVTDADGFTYAMTDLSSTGSNE